MAFTFRRVCTYIVNIAYLLFALKSQFLKSVPNIVKVSKLKIKKNSFLLVKIKITTMYVKCLKVQHH